MILYNDCIIITKTAIYFQMRDIWPFGVHGFRNSIKSGKMGYMAIIDTFASEFREVIGATFFLLSAFAAGGSRTGTPFSSGGFLGGDRACRDIYNSLTSSRDNAKIVKNQPDWDGNVNKKLTCC